jgi:hypothetical protein
VDSTPSLLGAPAVDPPSLHVDPPPVDPPSLPAGPPAPAEDNTAIAPPLAEEVAQCNPWLRHLRQRNKKKEKKRGRK